MQGLEYFGLYKAKQITGQIVQRLLLEGSKDILSPLTPSNSAQRTQRNLSLKQITVQDTGDAPPGGASPHQQRG